MVRVRSFTVRIVISTFGTCSSAEQMCKVAGRVEVIMSSTLNSPSPKISVILRSLEVYFRIIFLRCLMIVVAFYFSYDQ